MGKEAQKLSLKSLQEKYSRKGGKLTWELKVVAAAEGVVVATTT